MGQSGTGMPLAAWDCHMHAYEPGAKLAPTAPNAPPGEDAAAYAAMRGGAGAQAFVVQPSHYGLDNAVTLRAAAALGGRAVVVVGAAASERDLAALGTRGAIGARFHMARSPAVRWDELPAVAARIASLGWAVHVQMAGADLAERQQELLALPCPVVVEHFGRPARPANPADPAVLAVLRLLASGRGWVKLSSSYGMSVAEDPADPAVAALARRYAAEALGRVLWGSNWPHPNRASPAPPDNAILAAPAAWFGGDAGALRALLHDNPVALAASAAPG